MPFKLLLLCDEYQIKNPAWTNTNGGSLRMNIYAHDFELFVIVFSIPDDELCRGSRITIIRITVKIKIK